MSQNIVEEAKAFVKKHMENQDGSHDWFHIVRVFNIASSLADKEGVKDKEIVQLGALLHDINDWKYSGSFVLQRDGGRGICSSMAYSTIALFLSVATQPNLASDQFVKSQNYPSDKIDTVVRIIRGVSFKNELAGKIEVFPELSVVQDADRLDAIGAIGIARAFTYGGKKNRQLWNPAETAREGLTKADYMDQSVQQSTVAHFYEKLLKLKDMMKTKSGKEMAVKRHQVMEQYLEDFYAEWDGKL